VRNGVRLSETPTSIHSPSPALGEHNAELLGPANTDRKQERPRERK